MSLNREGRRLVDGLTNPGQTAEQLLDVLTFRRADGREISLREFPLAEALSTGETVRAEEIVIGVPDGRSVSVLLNATPIRSEEGQVESVVVTLQDMTALEELDRLRAEFLGMVSHELRAPLTSIKGSAATVLGSSADLDPAVVRQFFRIIDEQADHYLAVDTQLRPVLGWFGAYLTPTSVYLQSRDFESGRLTDPQTVASLHSLTAAVIALHRAIEEGPSSLGPLPLAAG